METYLEEKIGAPQLFSGRKKELQFFLNWIAGIPRRRTISRAILSRRKTGKTALLQRLYNLTFHDTSMGVIPFYYEIIEGKQWAIDFCQSFFTSFMYQYIAYKTRKKAYVNSSFYQYHDLNDLKKVCKKEGFDTFIPMINDLEIGIRNESIDSVWNQVRDTPRVIAFYNNEHILQIIDEFQYLNSEIYWDKDKKNRANDFAAGYMSTAEYKSAPLLISGSWVGWLMHDLSTMLPGRFRLTLVEKLPPDESLEMIYNYSKFYNIPITDEVAFLMGELCEGNPFYITALIESDYDKKNLTTMNGLLSTLNYEIYDDRGQIKRIWSEYLNAAISEINDRHAKNIILYLCKHRNRIITKKEIQRELKLDMSDQEFNKKMRAMIHADIIDRGGSSYQFQAVKDNIFDKVFLGEFGEEIENFDPNDLAHDARYMLVNMQKKYRQLLGKYNQKQGLYAEYAIIEQLMYRAFQNNTYFCNITNNLPDNFQFVQYEHVWSYKASPLQRSDFQVDIFARAKMDNYSLIGEVKCRHSKKFSISEAQAFLEKIQMLINLERLNQEWVVGMVYSVNGFYKNAIRFLEKHGIAWSAHEGWLDNQFNRT
jgi:hypothetical protein